MADPRSRSIEGNKGRSVVWPVNIDPSIGLCDISYRFDIVSIQMENGEVRFQLIKDAFKDLR